MTEPGRSSSFGRHRKIAPFLPGDEAALRAQSRAKAASLNQHVLGYGTLAEAEWTTAGVPAPDLAAMRRYRLDRIRAELRRRDYAGALLYDPINIRYATDSTNMQLWVAHNPTRHCFVAAEGPVILFDYFACEHLSDHSGVVDEVRPAVSWMFMYGGEWIETRLLSSGPRTNPWFQECSSRIIEAGDLVAFDTDLIGPYGFCADLSRTWLCGDVRPTNEQRDLFRFAADQIAHNTVLLRPGISFRDLAERSVVPPPDCFPTRYGVLYHGVGLADEYPTLPHAADWTDDTPDGVLEPGMVLCVESYIGRLGGREGVKIEEQVLITQTGAEPLSTYPLEERLLG
ncbi:MAG: M24 family metallopeptidase [Pseudomonadota bacterium]